MSKHILFVDGDQAIADAVHLMLREMGHRVSMLTSGMEALAVFSHDPAGFDLVITDLGMSDISGLLLAEKLLKMRGDIPIVLLTSEDGEKQSKERETGIRWFALKPISIDALAATVRSALAEAA
jgi:DNA-binding response OmpR family regulator